MAKLYRKKPVTIEAIQFDGTDESWQEIRDWINRQAVTRCVTHHDILHIFIETLEGPMRADPGDWIVRGVMGEFYPCKPDIFAATYSEVTYVNG